ncbi:hypothetical protein [Aurantibacter aestuarii]|uniref:Uncharacterized protein n=1 Tax=Aurantibacter aestuarii TaxID=1266046 RepID=A0A2T1NEM6_9FLAO|nr:hypothetical protein [Aurantibacter aestuarii]PSG90884.1 hypothetical protein C7H52_06315 [Aurantibacter aestuarii]
MSNLSQTNSRIEAKPYLTKETNPEMSWFGRAWRNAGIAIYNNAASILGTAIGGPLGAILMNLIEAGVNVTVNRGTGVYIDINAQTFDSLSLAETKNLHAWLKNVLGATVNKIVSAFDIVVTINTGRTSTETVIKSINEALNKIYLIQAYGFVIKEKGENGFSLAYSRQKAEIILKIVEYVEKALIIYAEQNTTGYKLVSETLLVSENVQIDNLLLEYQKTTVEQNFKTFVPKDAINTNGQADVIITNTDQNSTEPATPTTPATVVDKNKSNGLKWLGLGLFALAVAQVVKPKKSKNKK